MTSILLVDRQAASLIIVPGQVRSRVPGSRVTAIHCLLPDDGVLEWGRRVMAGVYLFVCRSKLFVCFACWSSLFCFC